MLLLENTDEQNMGPLILILKGGHRFAENFSLALTYERHPSNGFFMHCV